MSLWIGMVEEGRRAQKPRRSNEVQAIRAWLGLLLLVMMLLRSSHFYCIKDNSNGNKDARQLEFCSKSRQFKVVRRVRKGKARETRARRMHGDRGGYLVFALYFISTFVLTLYPTFW